MDIFSEFDYKQILKKKLLEKKAILGNRFTFERLAARIDVQKTYLSRVLHPEGPHLSADQLYRLACDLGFKGEERDYLQLLLDHDRSHDADRKIEIQGRIKALRQAQLRSENHLKIEPTFNAQELAAYFLNPDVILVHMFMCIESYRKNVSQIAEKLGLSAEALGQILVLLERHGFVSLVDQAYELKRDQSHLPADSTFFKPYLTLQRLKSMQRAQNLNSDRTYNFSVIFTATEESRQTIKREFFQFLAKVEQLVGESKNENVFQMNFDLFDWSC